MLFHWLIGLCKYNAIQGFLLVLVSWYQTAEWKQITEVSEVICNLVHSFWVLSRNFAWPIKLKQLPSILFLLSQKSFISVWFQTMKNDWLDEKFLKNLLPFKNFTVDLIGILFFSTSINFGKAQLSKLKSFFTEELKIS